MHVSHKSNVQGYVNCAVRNLDGMNSFNQSLCSWVLDIVYF